MRCACRVMKGCTSCGWWVVGGRREGARVVRVHGSGVGRRRELQPRTLDVGVDGDLQITLAGMGSWTLRSELGC
jgi:hypothetical protein